MFYCEFKDFCLHESTSVIDESMIKSTNKFRNIFFSPHKIAQNKTNKGKNLLMTFLCAQINYIPIISKERQSAIFRSCNNDREALKAMNFN